MPLEGQQEASAREIRPNPSQDEAGCLEPEALDYWICHYYRKEEASEYSYYKDHGENHEKWHNKLHNNDRFDQSFALIEALELHRLLNHIFGLSGDTCGQLAEPGVNQD